MAYEKVGWKNWPLKLTMISAENLDHMDSQIKENADNIGDMAKIADLGDNIADILSEQNTNYSQINSDMKLCFQSVSDGKALVASAITGKGVTTAQDATFDTMATNIGKIKNLHILGK